MIIAVCLLLGLLLRVASGRHLADLALVRLRGEAALLVLLVAQALLSVLKLTGSAAQVAYVAWVVTFPCLVFVALLNRRSPGMAMLGLGLLLNFLVIGLNSGMPVAMAAIGVVRPGLSSVPIAATDFVHVSATASTRLIWLADAIPIAGPSWLRSVVSPGDCLLFAGIVAFLAGATPRRLHKSELG